MSACTHAVCAENPMQPCIYEQGELFMSAGEGGSIKFDRGIDTTVTVAKTATVSGAHLMCECMNEIVLEDIRRGYHQPCMRLISVVLSPMERA